MSIDFEKLLYQAELSNSSSRPQKTFSLMETIARNKKEDLSPKERNLLAISYKHIISAIRASLTKINEIYDEESQKKDNGNLNLVLKLKNSIENELKDACTLIIDILDKHLIKNSSPDSKVFYYKLKGDYYRYLASFFTSGNYSQNAMIAYKQASQLSTSLSCVNPIKIDLALSYSVFLYDIVKNPDEAINIANEALQDALNIITEIDETEMKEATASLQMLKDNIDNWTKEQNKESEGIDDI